MTERMISVLANPERPSGATEIKARFSGEWCCQSVIAKLLIFLGMLLVPFPSQAFEDQWIDVTSQMKEEAGSLRLPGQRIYARRLSKAQSGLSPSSGRLYSAGSISYPDSRIGEIVTTDYRFECGTTEYTKKDGRKEWNQNGYYITPATSRASPDWFAYRFLCDWERDPWPWQYLEQSIKGDYLYLNKSSLREIDTNQLGPLRFALFVTVGSRSSDTSIDKPYESYLFAMSCPLMSITSEVPSGSFLPSQLQLVKPYPESLGEYVLDLVCKIDNL